MLAGYATCGNTNTEERARLNHCLQVSVKVTSKTELRIWMTVYRLSLPVRIERYKLVSNGSPFFNDDKWYKYLVNVMFSVHHTVSGHCFPRCSDNYVEYSEHFTCM